MKRVLVLLVATFCVVMLSSFASAELFRDEMVDPNGWGINQSTSDNTATFGYDYSADGIPEAPNGQGGDAATRGVKLESNNTDFVDSSEFFTLFPLGQNFTGNYQLQFDAWQNYSTFDRENNGGAGTTEFLGGGIGYDPNGTGNAGNGHQIISTSEGGSGSDYRAFKGGLFIDNEDMACGSRNATGCGGSGPYETLFPGGTVPPVAQGQTGVPNESRPGSSSFQWYTHTISVIGDEIRHQITNDSGVRRNILIYDNANADPNNGVPPPSVPTDGNISIFYADFFSSVSPSAAVTFGIVDNVVVTIPEPTSVVMFAMGGLGLAFVGRRRKAMKVGRCDNQVPGRQFRQSTRMDC